MQLAEADGLAAELLPILKPYCERIEVAGGVRRRKPEPHDLELVAKPLLVLNPGLFGSGGYLDNGLDAGMHQLLARKVIHPGLERVNHRGTRAIPMKAPFSEKYYNFQYRGQSVDLFVVTPPADWGPIFTIRTGDAAFTHWLVSYGWPKGIEFDQGIMWQHLDEKDRYIPLGKPHITPGHHRVQIPAPEEADVFRILDLPQYTPEQRSDAHIYTGRLMSV